MNAGPLASDLHILRSACLTHTTLSHNQPVADHGDTLTRSTSIHELMTTGSMNLNLWNPLYSIRFGT